MYTELIAGISALAGVVSAGFAVAAFFQAKEAKTVANKIYEMRFAIGMAGGGGHGGDAFGDGRGGAGGHGGRVDIGHPPR